MTDGVSVLICCYNSANKIVPTLEHLAKQQMPGNLPWEVLIIDNGCTDNTVDIAKETWEKCSVAVPLRIVQENFPGLSHARKTGILHANYSIICFCDDDNWLDHGYLAKAHSIMKENPEIGIVAGRGIAVSDTTIPEWFSDVQINYACGPQGQHTGDITSRTWAWGAGMILRNQYMRKLFHAGFFHINEDRKGNSLSSGGDSEISFWHVITGKKIWYDDDLTYCHFIPATRMTREFAQSIIAEHERSYNALYPYFPLLYAPHQNDNKFSLFCKALLSLIRRKEGSQYFIHLSPIFNSRLDPRTRQIMRNIENFKKEK